MRRWQIGVLGGEQIIGGNNLIYIYIYTGLDLCITDYSRANDTGLN